MSGRVSPRLLGLAIFYAVVCAMAIVKAQTALVRTTAVLSLTGTLGALAASRFCSEARVGRALRIVWVGALLAFVAMLFLRSHYGGSAIDGASAEDGHFLGSKPNRTAVSEQVYWTVAASEIAVAILLPAALALGAVPDSDERHV